MGYRLYISEESEQAIQRVTGINKDKQTLSTAAVCCVSMMVERMLDLSFPPELCAYFAERIGALTDDTGFYLLSGAIAGRFSLKHRICDEENAMAWIRDGAKAIVRYRYQPDGQMRYYLVDQYCNGTIYVINPSIQQGKGMSRSNKRLIQINDEYMMIPSESYRVFFPENAQYFIYSV